MSKERLVELIGNAPIGVNGITLLDKHEPMVIEEVADYLLANGVIVPHCKVGDKVYQYGKAFTKCTAFDYTPRHSDDSECEGCCAECDNKLYDVLFEGTVSTIHLYGNVLSVCVHWDNKWDNSYYEVGKTVFLTREEAEAKLKESEGK